MSLMPSVGSGTVGDRLRRALGDFRGWYKRQARQCLPASTVAWLCGSREARVVIYEAGDMIRTESWRGTEVLTAIQVPKSEWRSKAGAELPEAAGAAAAGRSVGLGIPRRMFLLRQLAMPRQALPGIDTLLARELEQQTPLRVADVYHNHAISSDTGGRVAQVGHWIIRKDIVSAAADRLEIPMASIDFVVPVDADQIASTATRVPVAAAAPHQRWQAQAMALLLCTAMALAALQVTLVMWRYDGAAQALDADISRASARAAEVRRKADEGTREQSLVGGLYHMKAERPGLLDLWEEVSRLLPDGTYITELRMSEAKPGELTVALTGFSDAAASLVALIDHSPMFTATSLTAAITPDPIEGRDRFSLQTRLKVQGRP
jgi:general secretion pathway protein L